MAAIIIEWSESRLSPMGESTNVKRHALLIRRCMLKISGGMKHIHKNCISVSENNSTQDQIGQGWIMSEANVSKLHKVFSWKNYGFVRTTPEEFENGALFLRFGLPSTLIRQENGALRKRSSNLRNAGFSFSCGQKTFENGAFWKRWPHDSHVISLLDIF